MFFNRIARIVAVATSLAVASAAPRAELVKRQSTDFYCIDVDFLGQCTPAIIGGGCINVAPEFNDNVSSFRVGEGFCNLFDDPNCQGRNITLRNPGSARLEQQNFDDVMSSYQCFSA